MSDGGGSSSATFKGSLMRKSGVLTLLLAGILTLGATAARGQGGTCPSNAQYVNTANPTGPLVTLASLGVTSCFYAAASGSDSNAGTSEASPWIHLPDMPLCTATCATVTPAPGEGFIIRGGDTYHYFTGSPQVGLPAAYPGGTANSGGAYAWWIKQSGTLANPIYWGVDQTWFTGASWHRPVFTNDNPIFTPSAPVYTDPTSTAVSSCLFPQQNLDDVSLGLNTQFYIFDNFEFTGMCWNDVSSNFSQTGKNEHNYIAHQQGGGTGTSPVWFLNIYMHGWSHTPFACPGISTSALGAGGSGYAVNDTGAIPSASDFVPPLSPQYKITGVSCGAVTSYTLTYPGTDIPPSGVTLPHTFSTVRGGAQPGSGTGFTVQVTAVANTVCGGPGGYYGSTQSTTGNDHYWFNVCDGADSDPLAFECFQNQAGDAEYNVMRWFAGAQIFNNCHIFANNLIEHISNGNDGAIHGDMWFCNGEFASNNFFYNNLVRDIATDFPLSKMSTILWFHPNGGFTDYFFNNVWHDVNCAGNCNNFTTPTTGTTTMLNYNNTMEAQIATAIWTNGATSPTTFSITDQNNHYITNNGTGCAAVYALATPVNGGVTSCAGDLFQTIAAANAAGYTSANDFAPISNSGATINAGVNESSLVSAFGTAFGSTTTNGCSYLVASHSVSCPAIAAVLRPTSGACPGTGCWNAGAFNFVPSSVTLTSATYTIAATAVGSNSGDSPVTFTLTNNTGVTITGVAISFTGANAGDFSNTTSCVTTLASSASCQIFVTFRPTATGTRTATLTVSDSDASSPQTSSLSGTAIPSVINPSPANPVTFGVVVADPSIPSTVKNEKHGENVSTYNFDRVVLAGFLH
jgi:hypothetical protein